MNKLSNLYFIALIPHEEIRISVKSLKEEMRDKFGAKHSLKSPAHITLIPPFRRTTMEENSISQALKQFSARQIPFSVKLFGFKSFPPRVIYIDVNNPDQIKLCYDDLLETLIASNCFNNDELKVKIHPHMTIAIKDLSKETFAKVWPEYEKRKFDTTFDVTSVFLLKHNGKFWDIYREFSFKTQ